MHLAFIKYLFAVVFRINNNYQKGVHFYLPHFSADVYFRCKLLKNTTNSIIYSQYTVRNVFCKCIQPLLRFISVFSYKNYFVLVKQPVSFIYITRVIWLQKCQIYELLRIIWSLTFLHTPITCSRISRKAETLCP